MSIDSNIANIWLPRDQVQNVFLSDLKCPPGWEDENADLGLNVCLHVSVSIHIYNQ